MNTIAIIGAGQLGSRHLQGVHKSRHDLEIYVVDSNRESLLIAESRYNQIKAGGIHTPHFLTGIDGLPPHIDLAIIATSSLPRFEVMKELLSKRTVGVLILEKFLFPKFGQYESARQIIEREGVTVLVNCPRRMYPAYDIIGNAIDRSKTISMVKRAPDWGLCCNAIHYIDIFMQLSGQSEFKVDTTGLLPEIVPSKRPGYIELYGTLRISTPRGDILELTSTDWEDKNILTIDNDRLHVEIDEAGGKTLSNGVEHYTPVIYQSDLSGEVTDLILDGKIPGLTPYDESRRYHEILFQGLASFVRRLPDAPDCVRNDDPLLPVT